MTLVHLCTYTLKYTKEKRRSSSVWIKFERKQYIDIILSDGCCCWRNFKREYEEGGEEVGAWKVLKLDDDAIIYLIYVIYDFERRSVTL